MQVANILGVPFSTRGLGATVADLSERVARGERTHVITANPEIVMIARERPDYFSIVEQAYVVPDGIGIVYAARWLGLPIRERVTGIDLMEALLAEADRHGWKVYLFGAAPDVNRRAAQTLAERYPNAAFVGNRHGYLEPGEEAAVAEEIAQAAPDLLFVALGAPRQDEWIARHWDRLNVRLAMGVGGSFDVIAGAVKRAPEVWQRLHLEWLYRLLSQPSRWRRQLAIPRFVWTVLRERRGIRPDSL